MIYIRSILTKKAICGLRIWTKGIKNLKDGVMRTKLLQEIECCRNQMISTAASTSLSNDEVLKLSKELDVLLNQYQEIEEKNK